MLSQAIRRLRYREGSTYALAPYQRPPKATAGAPVGAAPRPTLAIVPAGSAGGVGSHWVLLLALKLLAVSAALCVIVVVSFSV